MLSKGTIRANQPYSCVWTLKSHVKKQFLRRCRGTTTRNTPLFLVRFVTAAAARNVSEVELIDTSGS
jgi:hypothetical protein